eukprot:7514715-Alexandrium_andersonii.AAC.1
MRAAQRRATARLRGKPTQVCCAAQWHTPPVTRASPGSKAPLGPCQAEGAGGRAARGTRGSVQSDEAPSCKQKHTA